MSAFEPGTVAVATVDGVEDQRVWRSELGEWITMGGGGLSDDEVDDARPLVTLDLGINGGVAHLPGWMREAARLIRDRHPSGARGQIVDFLLSIADQIEAQSKPPRIPEPGLWGVVKSGGTEHISVGPDCWIGVADGKVRTWSSLKDPQPVRDGIEGTS